MLISMIVPLKTSLKLLIKLLDIIISRSSDQILVSPIDQDLDRTTNYWCKLYLVAFREQCRHVDEVQIKLEITKQHSWFQ